MVFEVVQTSLLVFIVGIPDGVLVFWCTTQLLACLGSTHVLAFWHTQQCMSLKTTQ